MKKRGLSRLKHPPGPEAALRLLVSRFFIKFHKIVKKRFLKLAVRKSRLDAKTATGHASVKAALVAHGNTLLRHSQIKQAINREANKTAKSVKDQLDKIIDVDVDTDLRDLVGSLSTSVFDELETGLDDSVDRAEDVLQDWEDLGEQSPRAGDLDALGFMLDSGLDGITGGALASVGLAFGYAFADMNASAQEQNGVASFTWVTVHDGNVRPEHAALDGLDFPWDGEPPLSAEDSDSGEACWPGEDYNCRCVSYPIDTDAESDPDLN